MKNILIIDIPTGPVFSTELFLNYNEQIQKYRAHSQDVFFRDNDIVAGPSRSYTRGLLLIAAILEQCDAKVFYFNSDADHKYEQGCLDLADKIDIVLFSVKTNTYPIILELLSKLKKRNPSIISILGGPHTTALPEQCLENKNIDFLVLGEGDQTIKELYFVLDRNSNPKDVAGLAYRDNNEIIVTGMRARLNVDQINSLPLPAYHLLPGNINDYYIYLETTRGCTYNCAFCSGPKYWHRCGVTRSANNFWSELQYLDKHLKNYNFLHISDPMFGITLAQKEIINLLQKEKMKFHFSCDVKANYITPELVQEMVKASINVFSIGIESTNDTSLKIIRKNIQAKQEVEACKKIKQISKSYIKSYWITGLPWETSESLLNQNELMYNLLKDGILDQVCNHILVPYPGTDLYARPDDFSLEIIHHNWLHYEGRSYPPVYRLNTLNEYEIYNYFLQSLILELKYYQKTFGISKLIPHQSDQSSSRESSQEVSFNKIKGRLL